MLPLPSELKALEVAILVATLSPKSVLLGLNELRVHLDPWAVAGLEGLGSAVIKPWVEAQSIKLPRQGLCANRSGPKRGGLPALPSNGSQVMLSLSFAFSMGGT